jgi:hypothetical protein
MAKVPQCWATYAHLQSQLSSQSNLDDHAWGLEGALNVILEPDFSPELTCEEEFRRAAASASRRRRDHVARFLTELNDEVDPSDGKDLLAEIVARQALRAIQDGIDQPEDLRLLSAVGHGHEYESLSRLLGQCESSLRGRALRLRRRFAHLRP